MNIAELQLAIVENYSRDIENEVIFSKFQKIVTQVLTEDIEESIEFIEKNCTDEEFFWISSFFEDVMAIKPSVQFCKALQDRLDQVSKSSYHQEEFQSDFMRKYIDYDEYKKDIQREIDYAKGQLWRLEEDADDAEKE